MQPVERGRFCQSCDKNVFDLSGMTRHEAHEVLRENAGKNICVRYCHDDAGVIRFRPERVAKAAVLAVAVAACTPHAPKERQVVGAIEPVPVVEDEIMGKIEEVKGDIGPEVMGAIEAIPPPPEPEPEPQPEDKPKEKPEPTHVRMGEMPAPPIQAIDAIEEQPCDKPPAARKGGGLTEL